MKVQKIKLSPYDYSWLVLDNNHLPVKPIIERIPINFLSVFKFTGVSRSWLYKEPTVRDLILKAKDHANNCLMQNQAIQIKTKDREIEILTKQNKMLRKQIDELRQQLEVAYAAIYKQD